MVDPHEVVQSNFEAKPMANMWCKIPENCVLAPHFITRYITVVCWIIMTQHLRILAEDQDLWDRSYHGRLID